MKATKRPKAKTFGSKKPKVSRRAKKKRATSTELPANARRPGLAPAHTGRAVRNCICMCCREHRRLDRQALRAHAEAAIGDYVVTGSVRCGANAIQALKDVLGAE